MKLFFYAMLYIACFGSMIGYQLEKEPLNTSGVFNFLSDLLKRLIIGALWPATAPVMFVRSWDEVSEEDNG